MALIAWTSRLFKRLINGDVDALEQLLEQQFHIVFHFVLIATKSETASKKIVKEAFHQLWQNRHTYKASESFESMLSEITEELVLNYLESIAKDQVLEEGLWNDIQEFKLVKLTNYEKPILSKEQEFSTATIRNNALQLQLITKLSTTEG